MTISSFMCHNICFLCTQTHMYILHTQTMQENSLVYSYNKICYILHTQGVCYKKNEISVSRRKTIIFQTYEGVEQTIISFKIQVIRRYEISLLLVTIFQRFHDVSWLPYFIIYREYETSWLPYVIDHVMMSRLYQIQNIMYHYKNFRAVL